MKKFIFLAFLLGACSTTKTFKLATDGKAQVNLLSWDNLDQEGKFLGETPIDLKIDEIKGQVLKISQPNRKPQYWSIVTDDGSSIEANIKLLNTFDSDGASTDLISDKTAFGELNRQFRMALRAYEALAKGNNQLAIELSKKLENMNNNIAAPHIISGLAFLNLDDKEKAGVSFAKAKSLDPSDIDVSKLIDLTK
jgi:hypothetical protein